MTKVPACLNQSTSDALYTNWHCETWRSVIKKIVRIRYKDFVFDEPLRFDLLVDNCLLIEAKSVEHIIPIHKAQLLSYMKLLDVTVGLLINFNVSVLKDGVSRLYLPGCNQP